MYFWATQFIATNHVMKKKGRNCTFSNWEENSVGRDRSNEELEWSSWLALITRLLFLFFQIFHEKLVQRSLCLSMKTLVSGKICGACCKVHWEFTFWQGIKTSECHYC